MVSTSKILTVSYGTFSCTLEGFDESFDTMKAIAEYFRDLAADDRYFGAEPPTPDADMLARIAEREIARRVEAHDAEGRIHLRAAALAANNETTEVPADALPAGGTAATVPDVAAESSVLSPARDAAELSPISGDAFDSIEQDDTTPGDDTLDDAAAFMETETPSRTQAPAASADAHPDENSVADKLRRIRAVASPETTGFSASAYSEDEHAQDFLADTAAELDEILAQDDAVQQATEDASESDEDQIDFDALAAMQTEDAQVDADAIEDSDSTLESEAATTDDDILSALASQDTSAEQSTDDADYDDDYIASDAGPANVEDTLAQLMADAMEGASDKPADQPDVTSETTEDVAEDTPQEIEPAIETADGDATKRPLNARVIKMKRRDFEAAIEDAQIEEDTDPAAVLSADAEAELQRELAEVEAEVAETLGQSDDTLVAEEPTEPAVQQSAPKKDSAARLSPEADDVEAARMFKEADTQLDDSEGSQRRSDIKHLRAAVAAAKAEKNAGGEIHRETDAAPYQHDLEQVVRPRRPQASGASRAERPATERPAPLRLVAEQRIDTPREPVRPRRVSLATATPDETSAAAASPEPAPKPAPAPAPVAAPTSEQSPAASADFADYAEQVGANSLTEMLEAAAAYLSDVEGRDQFSRPMLMHKLRELDEETFSREDGLRSFGQLLREGKLQKLKGGRFTVTAETDFRKAG